ncbi:MAG: glycosyl hydrolase 53 domain protein [Gammaproteobacteria bacterium]|nr:glycosyl hydrolase 53 domain protein [Gammaproteobacteria bacterium]
MLQLTASAATFAANSTGGRDRVTQQPRSFSSSSQRWALARVGVSGWQIENVAAELCLTDEEEQVELRECRAGFTARWKLRVAQNTPWWKDNGQPQDVLSIFKNHGINMIRVRPTSAPPYVDPSVTGCQGNACYAETEAQDLDPAKRARNLGMSIQLSLLFDGGNSRSIPAAWASDTLQQAQADLYSYVKAEIERYRSAGVIFTLVNQNGIPYDVICQPVSTTKAVSTPTIRGIRRQFPTSGNSCLICRVS